MANKITLEVLSDPNSTQLCNDCEIHLAMHMVGNRYQCCACYVSDGNAPADWHIKCMQEYNRLHP